jgi:hypothetical protein
MELPLEEYCHREKKLTLVSEALIPCKVRQLNEFCILTTLPLTYIGNTCIYNESCYKLLYEIQAIYTRYNC